MLIGPYFEDPYFWHTLIAKFKDIFIKIIEIYIFINQ